MSDADTLLRAGDLPGARAALAAVVKANPSDQAARLFLFQLMCVLCDWDKADVQLRALASLSPEAQMLSVTYSMATSAERERAAAFSGVGLAAVLVSNHPWAGEVAAALTLEAQNDSNAAVRRAAAFDHAEDTPGTLNDLRFDWIADADPRFGPTFEAIIAGKWGLVPFDAVESVTSKGPFDLRDLVWLPAQVMFRSGQSVNALLPTRYSGLGPTSSSDHLLARSTDWQNDAACGAKVWMTSGGDEISILALRSLRLDARP